MYYSNLKLQDISSGSGVRVSLYVSGCEHHCPGCFNPEAWQFHFGEIFDNDALARLTNALEPPYIQGLTLLGGEPLHPKNQEGVFKLVKTINEKFPKKDIWCYTGYDFERELYPESMRNQTLQKLLLQLDVLVDGRFDATKKDLTLQFRGSTNQRILLIRESLREKRPVFWEN